MLSTITLQSLVMGQGTNYSILDAKGFESPNVEISFHPLAGRHGVSVHRALYRDRRIRLEFGLRSATVAGYAALREAILKAFDLPRAGNTLMTFTTTDGKQLQLTVNLASVIDGGFQPGFITTGRIRVELIAGDPNIYGQTLNEINLSPPLPGGITLPTAIPFALSVSGGSDTIANNGNGNSWPSLRITGPVTNPTVSNNTLGLDFTILTTIGSGQFVDVDPNLQTVLFNGVTNYIQYFDGDWWWLKPGNNLIAFNGDATASLRLRWRSAYLGI